MAKVKTKWVCQNCGYETVSYLGRCPECSQFGTFVEEVTSSTSKIESSKPSNIIPTETKISKIKDLSKIEQITAKLFGMRRKMIRGIMPNVDWQAFGLTGTERAENLSPEIFALLANNLL